MEFKIYIYLAIVGAFLTSASIGYTFLNYGKLDVVWPFRTAINIAQIHENWEDYDIYYAGYSTAFPAAVMFDPKGDKRRLVSDAWVQVKDRETLLGLIDRLWVDTQYYYPKLRKILGPDNQLYGYMYTAWDHAVMKAVDTGTLWVRDLPHRPIGFEPG
jgi:hypothetical protein